MRVATGNAASGLLFVGAWQRRSSIELRFFVSLEKKPDHF